MEIKLPDKYDSAEIAKIISRVLTEVSNASKNTKVLDEVTTAGTRPPDITERKIHFRRDGTTRELILRDQGQTFKLTLTKV